MNAGQIAALLEGVGAEKVRIVGPHKVSCACPLATWTHSTGRDNHPSFIVFTQGKYGDPICKCMACHENGSLRDVLLFMWSRGRDTFHWIEVLDSGASLDEAKKSERLLGAHKASGVQGFQVTHAEHVPEMVEREPTPDGRPFYDYKCLAEAETIPEIPWKEYEPYAGRVPQYAIERGLTLDTCREWQLGHDARSKRLLFPIRDRAGRLVAISGRSYATACVSCDGAWAVLCAECGADEEWHAKHETNHAWEPGAESCIRCGLTRSPKYLHRKGFKRNLLLFGEHRVSDETDGRVYVVEGHLDVIRMWQAGYRPVVGLLGSSAGEPQVEKLVKHWGHGRIIAVPDGDMGGREMVARLKKLIAGRVPLTAKKLPDGSDPGSLSEGELEGLLGSPPVRLTKRDVGVTSVVTGSLEP